MTVLVLAGPQADPPDPERVLSDAGGPVVVLGGDEAAHERVAAWDTGEVEYRAVARARRDSARRVVATRVGDHPRAARLRERLGLGGPGVDAVLGLHDGLLSRRRAAGAGLPVVPFSAVDTVEDLVAFSDGPVLVGGRSGEEAPRLLRSWADVEQWACELPASLDEPLGLVAWRWCPEPRTTVAGVTVGDRWLWRAAGEEPPSPDARRPTDGTWWQDLADEWARRAGCGEAPVSVQLDLIRDPVRGPMLVSTGPAAPSARAVALLAVDVDLDAVDLRGQAGLPVTLPHDGRPAVRWALAGAPPADADLLGVWRDRAVLRGRDGAIAVRPHRHGGGRDA